PRDTDVVYIGGDLMSVGKGRDVKYTASMWRCRISAKDGRFQATARSIGANVHSDVHALVHVPGSPNVLWAACDGGVFVNRNPGRGGKFESRNDNLACLCTTFFAQHPRDPHILISGVQDNGAVRKSNGLTWNNVQWGDGGYCAINAANPKEVLILIHNVILKATDGGLRLKSWEPKKILATPTSIAPLVSTPYERMNGQSIEGPQSVAVGSQASKRKGQWFAHVLLSSNFGETWRPIASIPSSQGQGIYSMAFSSNNCLFVGTTTGEVFRLDRKGRSWLKTRLRGLGAIGMVSDIAVDWSDHHGRSIYITLGGMGHYRHVWHFNGQRNRWTPRSGPKNGASLLDVEHNAIIVDRKNPNDVYVAADIGVWRSCDRGSTWHPFSDGLPEVAVFDLQIHPEQPLLRAATYGRGLYEHKLQASEHSS
ncbi:MAG TPA: hypothetical protein VKT80_16530, partial [Chloroflexota bacterium]|nr:hypothetical protein [Chloroflexota bacterium]